MARSERDRLTSRQPVPDLRFVQVYAVDSNPTQPVQVLTLIWNGTAYVTSGGMFRIGDTLTRQKFHTGDRLWVIWRPDSRRWEPLGDLENFRLIRGQSYGAQSGPFILIYNVKVLAGGLDPTNGVLGVFVRVANIYNAAFTNNQFVDAAYSPQVGLIPPCDWEALGGGGGSEKFRLISGIAYTPSPPGTLTFLINDVEVLAGGLDPRVVPDSLTETITIHKDGDMCHIAVGDLVTAAYYLNQWNIIHSERFRAIRGKFFSAVSVSVVRLDHIQVLESGRDPRSDPNSATETVTVNLIAAGDTYVAGDDVWADWNAKQQAWEARPKTSTGTTVRRALLKLTASLAAATDVGGARVPATTASFTTIKGASSGTIENVSLKAIPSGTYVVTLEIGAANDTIIDAFC